MFLDEKNQENKEVNEKDSSLENKNESLQKNIVNPEKEFFDNENSDETTIQKDELDSLNEETADSDDQHDLKEIII